jgi:predicted nucleotidyltransferase component of viral defense system
MLGDAELHREAAATGFRPEVLEKVIRLLEFLDGIRSHPYLKPRLVLKGGTALNLFVYNLPRLSVDIDLNYTGSPERETMLADRPRIEQAIRAVCARMGVQIRRIPGEHAGGKWRLSYASVTGRPGMLEVDVNFLLRTPLWPPVATDSKRVGAFGVTDVPLLDVHELAAGKLGALFGRGASRDLFDVRELFGATSLDADKLRLGFVVYGGINRRDWRTVTLDDVHADPVEVERQLVPLLRAGVAPRREALASWTGRLVEECRDWLSAVLPLRAEEVEFLHRLNDQGDIAPELLTVDADMQRLLNSHAGLRWKAINVRKYRGLDMEAEESGSP